MSMAEIDDFLGKIETSTINRFTILAKVRDMVFGDSTFIAESFEGAFRRNLDKEYDSGWCPSSHLDH